MLYYPQAEIGTRLTKQLLKLTQAIAIFHKKDSIDDDEMDCLVSIARDSVPRQRLELMVALSSDNEYTDTTTIGEASDTPTQTAKESLEELWMLKMLEP